MTHGNVKETIIKNVCFRYKKKLGNELSIEFLHATIIFFVVFIFIFDIIQTISDYKTIPP